MPRSVVTVNDISKKFEIPIEKSSGIKQKIINIVKHRKGYREFIPLQHISFEVHEGDFFGIVGKNGSGKSTLLKTIAGIYSPSSGSVNVEGSLVPFIELGVGFNPELTGRENVYLNGALLGFSRSEMDAMYDEIVDFAELHDFMEERLKNYSSGMQVRLAFSVAIQAKGDILLLDEILAVGDEAFQRKCYEYFKALKEDKKTVILVTHDMSAVQKFCNKAILIHNGEIKTIGSPSDVANQYTEENFKTSDKPTKKGQYPAGLSERIVDFKITPISKTILSSDNEFIFDIEYSITDDTPVYVAFSIVDLNRSGSILDKRSQIRNTKGINRFSYSLPLSLFNNGDFMVTAVLDEEESKRRIAYTSESNSGKFAIRNKNSKSNGLLKDLGGWIE